MKGRAAPSPATAAPEGSDDGNRRPSPFANFYKACPRDPYHDAAPKEPTPSATARCYGRDATNGKRCAYTSDHIGLHTWSEDLEADWRNRPSGETPSEEA